MRRVACTIGALIVLVASAACSGGESSNSGGATPPPIPTRSSPPTAPLPVVTVAGGAPEVTRFAAPAAFTCLAGDPAQAQVTIGWDVPSATEVALTLDGSPPASGIQASPPYQVPAGPPAGPGVTVVFSCEAVDHAISLSWRADGSPATERTFTITKATGP